MAVERPASDSAVVHVAGVLDAVAVPDLWELLQAQSPGPGPRAVVVDLSETTFIGFAGLQLLVRAAARRTRPHRPAACARAPSWSTAPST